MEKNSVLGDVIDTRAAKVGTPDARWGGRGHSVAWVARVYISGYFMTHIRPSCLRAGA